MNPPEGLVGHTLRDGEYLVREVLGHGGMATVYRAYSRSLETDVALKVLAPSLAVNLELRERFHQEARLLSRLFHPNLLTVHFFGEEGEVVYIAMRLVRGGTLRDRLNAMGGTLDLVTAARLVRGVGDALQAAHDADVVHLDVKPSNVLLGRADWTLLADTGIAEVIEPTTSTGRRRIAGTPAYMSPEQCRGEAVDGSSDQYSLAVMAYELLTGRVPFPGVTPEETMRHQIEDTPPRPRELNPGLPSPVEDILLRGMAKRPADRFPSVAEFGRTLAEAAERTRGMSLETKTSVADAAPNIVGALALLTLGPLLLLTLPAGALIGSIPLAWPFQVAFAIGLAALLLGVRWHVVGLFVRAANALVDAVERANAGSARGRPPLSGLRRAVVGSAEGIVNLLYVLGLYRLVGVPLVGLIGGLIDPTFTRVLGLLLLAGATLATLLVVVGIARSAGVRAALVVLGLGWTLTWALSSADLGLGGAVGALSTLRLLVGAAIVAVLVSQRSRTAELLGASAASGLSRLMLESHDETSPGAVTANRRRMALVVAAVLDMLYLLVGYALLRTPLTEELQLVLPAVTAAAVVTAIAGLIWVVLIVRLQVLAGALGVLLGLLLGAPLLLSLPLLDGRFARDVPTVASTSIAWVVGIGLLLLLIGVRSRLNSVGRASLGGRLDRGLLGINAADDEFAQQRRSGAFGRIAGAFIDVGLLVLAYWIVGAPIAAGLVRSTGKAWIGAAALAVLLAAIVAVLGVALLRTRRTLDETGGSAWRTRATALGLLCMLLLPLTAVLGAAAPAALASPAATGALELQPSRVPMLVVDWDFWLPWTPDQDQATYQLAMSCTDGTRIGEFRETFRPPAGAPMPAGRVGQLGVTNLPCDAWQSEYAARRQAAGLGNTSSLSTDALDVSATVNSDNSVDVVETHRVTFTSGPQDHLASRIGAPAGNLSRLSVSEGDVQYPVDPSAPFPPRYARSWQEGGQTWVGWWFPAVDSPAQRTYTISYRLTGAVRDTANAGHALDWRVLPSDPDQPIWMATLALRLPSDVQSDTVHLQADGATAQSGLLDGQSAWFTAASALAATPLDASVDFGGQAPGLPTPPPVPTQTPTPSPTPTSSPTAAATATAQPSPSPTEVALVTEVATEVATEAATVEATTPPTLSPTPTVQAPTATAAATDIPQPTDTPLPEPSPSVVATETPQPSPPPTDTPAPSPPATDTPAATATVALSPSATPTNTPAPTPTDTSVPTETPTPTRTPRPPTNTPTLTPTATLSPTATVAPTATWSPTPTNTPRPSPTLPPTVAPTTVSLQRITVSPANPTIFIGQRLPMTATALFSDGTQQDVTHTATWRSSDPSSVSVASPGLVVGQKMGSATISASVGSATGSTTVNSIPQLQ